VRNEQSQELLARLLEQSSVGVVPESIHVAYAYSLLVVSQLVQQGFPIKANCSIEPTGALCAYFFS
jgi:hypothetical protein